MGDDHCGHHQGVMEHAEKAVRVMESTSGVSGVCSLADTPSMQNRSTLHETISSRSWLVHPFGLESALATY